VAISEVYHLGSLAEASKAMILLHGRGGTGRSMLGLADQLCDGSFYVAAPESEGNSWYPKSFMVEEKLNEPFLSDSVRAIHELTEEIAEYLPREQIFVVGFSQGACLALEVTARFAAKYGGVVAFTGGLIGKDIDKTRYQGDFEGTKVFISNGDQDPHIPLVRSQESKEIMESLGAHVTLKVYQGKPHAVSEDEIKLVKETVF